MAPLGSAHGSYSLGLRALGLSPSAESAPALGFHQSVSSSVRALSADNHTDTVCPYISVLCVRIGAPLGDTHLFVSAGPSPMPTTGIGALGKQVVIKCWAFYRKTWTR